MWNKCGTWNVLWKQIIILSLALFNTIVTCEIFWLYNLEQLVILHSSNLNTIHHNFSVIATLFQLLHSLIEINSICEHVHGSDDNIMYKIIFIIYSLSTYLKTVTQARVCSTFSSEIFLFSVISLGKVLLESLAFGFILVLDLHVLESYT